MIRTRESVAETAKRIIDKRPVLEPIIKAFEGIFEARASLPMDLLPLVKKSKLTLPEFNEDYAAHGRSLLSDMSLKGFDATLTGSAKKLLPLLANQEYLQPYISTLEIYFGTKKASKKSTKKDEAVVEKKEVKAPYKSYELAEAYLANNADVIEKTAEAINVPTQALLFAFSWILAPALQALVLYSIPALQEKVELSSDEGIEENTSNTNDKTAPWDKNSRWKEGYCPVCASFPSISYLERSLIDENNQFLASGGGKKYLHCSLCGTDWHFKRGACPSCKEEGPETIEIIKETKKETGERIDWCKKCNSYCPNVDLRVGGLRPNFDMMALGMMHLDMIAAEKKLMPLNPSFWNTFE